LRLRRFGTTPFPANLCEVQLKKLLAFAALGVFALACDGPTATTPTADHQLASSAQAPSTATWAVNQPFANAAGGVIHQVSVGGHDFSDPGADANFSLVAIEHSDGSVSGQWTDQFGQGDGGLHIVIDCLRVVGNQAWVSGTVTSGTFGGTDFTGRPAITRIADNGTSANDPPDQIGFTSLPNNPISCQTAPPLQLFPMPDGQVKVR